MSETPVPNPETSPLPGPESVPQPDGARPQAQTGAELAVASAALPAHLAKLADQARDYARAARAENTQRAYDSDWKQFRAWLRRQELDLDPVTPQTLGLYIAACASGAATRDRKPSAVRTIERRLSAICWRLAQEGAPIDRADPHIATVMAGVRRSHGKPPVQKEAVLPGDLIAMLETLDRGALRGLRDRTILLVGFAGGLRRSEIVSLDCGSGQTGDSASWVEILKDGLLLHIRGKTGWREVEIGRGSL